MNFFLLCFTLFYLFFYVESRAFKVKKMLNLILSIEEFILTAGSDRLTCCGKHLKTNSFLLIRCPKAERLPRIFG